MFLAGYGRKCLVDYRSAFAGPKNTPEVEDHANDLLSLDANKYKMIEVSDTVEKLKIKALASIPCEDEFIRSYCEKNNETFRSQTVNNNSKYYRCKHKTRYRNTMEVEAYMREHPNARMQNTN